MAGKPRGFTIDTDFRPLSFSSNANASGQVICAGYGLVIPEESDKPGYDSYKGLDVSGKVVLVFDDVPAEIDTNDRIRFLHYSSPRYKAKQALKRGAAGFLVVIGPNTAGSGSLLPLGSSGTDAGIVAGQHLDRIGGGVAERRRRHAR